MASDVDICNLALSHISNDDVVTAITPPDGTAAADHCARFYPIARDECLEFGSWSFATRRAALAELESNAQEARWGYAYSLPNLCIRPLQVYLPGAVDDSEPQDFEVETLESGATVLYTDVEDAELKFIWKQTDTTKYTPSFVVALSYKLAQYLAGPVARNEKKAVAMAEIAENLMLPRAAARNKARQSSLYKNFTPSHLAVRR